MVIFDTLPMAERHIILIDSFWTVINVFTGIFAIYSKK
jgi:hypothetical protein